MPVDVREPTPTERQLLLFNLATQPCACLARQKADRQTIVECSVRRDDLAEKTCIDAMLRCEVCQYEHRAKMIICE